MLNDSLQANGQFTHEKQLFVFLHKVHLPLNFTVNFPFHLGKKIEPSKKLVTD